MSDGRTPDFSAARAVITAGLESRAFPAAVANVGRSDGSLWHEAFGRVTYEADARPCTIDTVFDLASLTKVIATASIAMRQIARRTLRLEMRVCEVFPAFSGDQKSLVTIRHLLDHSSGLPARAPLYEHCKGRDEYLRAICAMNLEREPGRSAVYSDPGFILLGLLLEETGAARLDAQFHELSTSLPALITFHPDDEIRGRTAPTEDDPWRGRLLAGEVHDENAAAMGGVAGHAGLFGTAAAVGAFARLVLRTFKKTTALATPQTLHLFATRSAVPESSRALGWDTALPTSSCGSRMTPGSIGHTGFTGTSLWIDRARDLYAVLLTNRVHPTRSNEKFLPLRAKFHDALPF